MTASLLTGLLAPSDLAMTGEITLRGKVLPIGGIKEKVIAANSAGIRRVILPDKIAKDLEDVSDPVKAALSFHFVQEIDAVLDLVFGEALRSRPAAESPALPAVEGEEAEDEAVVPTETAN